MTVTSNVVKYRDIQYMKGGGLWVYVLRHSRAGAVSAACYIQTITLTMFTKTLAEKGYSEKQGHRRASNTDVEESTQIYHFKVMPGCL